MDDTRAPGTTQECVTHTTNYETKHETSSYVDAELLGVNQATERRLRTKIDLTICPIVCLLYLFCYIDRANIGGIHCHTQPLLIEIADG